MCEQKVVLEKIHKAGKMNGFAVEMAEAQVKDYVMMDRKVTRIEKDVAAIKKDQKKVFEMLARQGGQIDLIVKRLDSPVESERLEGAYWRALATVCKSKVFWLIVIAIVFFIAMTGSEIKHLLGWLPVGA